MRRLSILILGALALTFVAFDAGTASAAKVKFHDNPEALWTACNGSSGRTHDGIVCTPTTTDDGAPHGYRVPPLAPKHPPQHTGGGTFGPFGNS